MKSYTHFTLEEREYLEESLKKGKSLRSIAKALDRSLSTISHSLRSSHPSSVEPERITARNSFFSRSASASREAISNIKAGAFISPGFSLPHTFISSERERLKYFRK